MTSVLRWTFRPCFDCFSLCLLCRYNPYSSLTELLETKILEKLIHRIPQCLEFLWVQGKFRASHSINQVGSGVRTNTLNQCQSKNCINYIYAPGITGSLIHIRWDLQESYLYHIQSTFALKSYELMRYHDYWGQAFLTISLHFAQLHRFLNCQRETWMKHLLNLCTQFWAKSSFLTRWKIEPSKSEKLTVQLSFDARGPENFPKNKMRPTLQHSHLLQSVMLQDVSYIPSGRHGDRRQRSCWCVAWESHEPWRNGCTRSDRNYSTYLPVATSV